jgi:3',5'-cyclic AMP phosphodiesterase CpdA
MKKLILLSAFFCAVALSASAQFTFVHMSDLHVSATPAPNSDTNAQYFRCAVAEFASLSPKPEFVVISGDISDIGNMQPEGMYPTFTQYLFPSSLSNPGAGDYYIDAAKTIPVYFTPGNHEYWTSFDSINLPISNDTLFFYPHYISPDADFAIVKDLAVIVVLRSGHDTPYTYPPNPLLTQGTGLSNEQISWLRVVLGMHSTKRKIIVMHHPPVNATGTNSDGTPFTEVHPIDTATNSLHNNRSTFLNICDSNHVDLILAGHEHQNVVASRKGDTVGENWTGGTRYVQTAASFNRSFRIISVDPAFITVSRPMRSCSGTGISELTNSINLSVFPNPATGKITVECSEKATLEISAINGQIIQSIPGAVTTATFDLGNITGGVYLLKARTTGGVAVRKFIKQ